MKSASTFTLDYSDIAYNRSLNRLYRNNLQFRKAFHENNVDKYFPKKH